MSSIDTIVFDLGGVLVDWNPRYLYRKLIADEKQMEQFLTDVCNSAWNELHDAGQSLAKGTEDLVARFPTQEKWIRAYFSRWTEMVAGEIPGTASILGEIRRQGRHKIVALSNWSAETFPLVRGRFPFFSHFDHILLSGEERMLKPDPRFFSLLTSRYQIAPERAVFIDDVEKNIRAGESLGFKSIQFRDALALRHELTQLGVLDVPIQH